MIRSRKDKRKSNHSPAVERKLRKVRLSRKQTHAVILFPAPFPNAIANLGFLTIWDRLNTAGDFLCDRAVWDPRHPSEPEGIETGLPLSAFPLIFISSSTELDLPAVIDALIASGIEPEAGSRQGRPLIVAGGITLTLNPAPWAPLLDLAILGEGEDAILPWISLYADWQKQSGSRPELLQASSALPFLWIPDQEDRMVTPARYESFTEHPAFSTVVHPDGHFGDCFLIETTRGCPRRCKFCAACAAFSARFASADAIINTIDSTHCLTAPKVGLVGAAVGDHPRLKQIVAHVLLSGKEITLSSLRIESTDAELLDLLTEGGFRSLTIAPEAGSEGERFKLGKKATDADILKLAQIAAEKGINHLRMYFLIGLPEAEPADSIARLINWLRKETPSSLFLDLSVASFIPKPFTPWEGEPFAGIPTLDHVKKQIKDAIKPLSRVDVRFESTRMEQIAVLLSRGDRRIGEVLIAAKKSSRSFNQQIRLDNLDLTPYLAPADTDYILPWKVIHPHD
ncbi:MAG: radical SAM protein [bacterium]